MAANAKKQVATTKKALQAADAQYAPGTVLVFGGTDEVTISTVFADTRSSSILYPAALNKCIIGSWFPKRMARR